MGGPGRNAHILIIWSSGVKKQRDHACPLTKEAAILITFNPHHGLWDLRIPNIITYLETKARSFKSNEHIRNKVDGPYFKVSAKKAASVTL